MTMVKPFKKPDLNAPRFRPGCLGMLNKEFLDKFREKYPQYKDIKDSKLKTIIKSFNKLIWETVIQERDGVELPEGLGYIFLGTCMPTKRYNTHYGKSIELNSRVKARNWESDNHLLKIFYSNYASKYHYKNRRMWYFKAVRDFTRAASAAYRLDWTKYVRVEDTAKVSAMFKKSKKRDYAIKMAVVPPGYNEFSFD